MSQPSSRDSTFEELQRYLQEEEELNRRSNPSPNNASGTAHESASSVVTTPDPLNTAFIDETLVDEPGSQHSLSQQPQSQTTKTAASTLADVIGTIVEQEQGAIHPHTPRKTMTVSTGTMPKTPTMKSTGTMPMTPLMVSKGTMPKTPTLACTTWTMPRTPTMTSTGTMPKTPTTIDLVSPTIEVIDLVSPDTPTNTDSPTATPGQAPQ